MTDRRVPDLLLDPGLAPLWEVVRRQLDRFGTRRRGTIARPRLDPSNDLTLRSLLGRRPTGRLDLGDLERALVDLRISQDLCGALTRLGYPPSEDAARRRVARLRSRGARDALSRGVVSWEEPWAREWADEMVRTGVLGDLDRQAVEALIVDVRCFLDRLGGVEPSGISQTELAATLFGSAHALDEGRKLAAAITQALRYREEGGFPARTPSSVGGGRHPAAPRVSTGAHLAFAGRGRNSPRRADPVGVRRRAPAPYKPVRPTEVSHHRSATDTGPRRREPAARRSRRRT